jgi:hypothetical protein
MHGLAEAIGTHRVELGVRDLSVVVEVEFGEQVIRQPALTVHQALHRAIRRRWAVHLGEWQVGSGDDRCGTCKQRDFDIGFMSDPLSKSPPFPESQRIVSMCDARPRSDTICANFPVARPAHCHMLASHFRSCVPLRWP